MRVLLVVLDENASSPFSCYHYLIDDGDESSF